MKVLFVFFIVLLLAISATASDRCDNIVVPAKKASQYYLGQEFPWWYNVGVAKKETECRWVTSVDGHGSVGYFQLTPKFLDKLLRPFFPDYDKAYSMQHFQAFAYYIGVLWKSNPVRKLWVLYQRYNGGDWVVKECKKAKCWVWDECYKQCKRGNVCVWVASTGCKQWRSACDINYDYSMKVYKYGQIWKEGEDRILFW